MPDLKLTYFDFNGGRAEPARLAMLIAGISFEDHRFGHTQWPEVREQTPFKAVPTLSVDGEVFTQSNSLHRYVAKLANLYPTDPLEALRCDEVMDVVEDQTKELSASFSMPPEEKKLAREKLVAGSLPHLLGWLNSKLESRGDFFADQRLTIADLKVFVSIRSLKSGQLDHIPTDLVEKCAPLLHQHYERLLQHPVLAKRYL